MRHGRLPAIPRTSGTVSIPTTGHFVALSRPRHCQCQSSPYKLECEVPCAAAWRRRARLRRGPVEFEHAANRRGRLGAPPDWPESFLLLSGASSVALPETCCLPVWPGQRFPLAERSPFLSVLRPLWLQWSSEVACRPVLWQSTSSSGLCLSESSLCRSAG